MPHPLFHPLVPAMSLPEASSVLAHPGTVAAHARAKATHAATRPSHAPAISHAEAGVRIDLALFPIQIDPFLAHLSLEIAELLLESLRFFQVRVRCVHQDV